MNFNQKKGDSEIADLILDCKKLVLTINECDCFQIYTFELKCMNLAGAFVQNNMKKSLIQATVVQGKASGNRCGNI